MVFRCSLLFRHTHTVHTVCSTRHTYAQSSHIRRMTNRSRSSPPKIRLKQHFPHNPFNFSFFTKSFFKIFFQNLFFFFISYFLMMGSFISLFIILQVCVENHLINQSTTNIQYQVDRIGIEFKFINKQGAREKISKNHHGQKRRFRNDWLIDWLIGFRNDLAIFLLSIHR